jgi:hypothetical protein
MERVESQSRSVCIGRGWVRMGKARRVMHTDMVDMGNRMEKRIVRVKRVAGKAVSRVGC